MKKVIGGLEDPEAPLNKVFDPFSFFHLKILVCVCFSPLLSTHLTLIIWISVKKSDHNSILKRHRGPDLIKTDMKLMFSSDPSVISDCK